MIFYCMIFGLTSIKQATFNKERSIFEIIFRKCLEHIFTHVWYPQFLTFLEMFVSTFLHKFSFIVTCF